MITDVIGQLQRFAGQSGIKRECACRDWDQAWALRLNCQDQLKRWCKSVIIGELRRDHAETSPGQAVAAPPEVTSLNRLVASNRCSIRLVRSFPN